MYLVVSSAFQTCPLNEGGKVGGFEGLLRIGFRGSQSPSLATGKTAALHLRGHIDTKKSTKVIACK